MPNKVTTLIYSNNIIVFTTEYLTEQIQDLGQTRMEFENQRKHKLTRFEHCKPSIKKKIEKNFDCNIDKPVNNMHICTDVHIYSDPDGTVIGKAQRHFQVPCRADPASPGGYAGPCR